MRVDPTKMILPYLLLEGGFPSRNGLRVSSVTPIRMGNKLLFYPFIATV
jgi:hypothetical protein